MTSNTSSLFSSALGTSRLEAPDEIQRPGDFGSTHNEPPGGEDEISKPGLDLSRLEGYELATDRKKIKSFVWDHGWRLHNNAGLEY
jgi:hypothetical protein